MAVRPASVFYNVRASSVGAIIICLVQCGEDFQITLGFWVLNGMKPTIDCEYDSVPDTLTVNNNSFHLSLNDEVCCNFCLSPMPQIPH